MRKWIDFLGIICLLSALAGCGGSGAEASDSETEAADLSVAESAAQAGATGVSGGVFIRLNGNTAESDSSAVQISGGTVTITGAGKYVVSGILTDGMLIVDAGKSDPVELVLNGADITSGSSASVYVRQAGRLTVTLADGSANVLSNGGEYLAIDDNNIDAVIFSKDDLSLEGNGTLTISAEAGHGVVSKDSLEIKNGVYLVQAAGHGFSANDSIEISGGSFEITAGKDGFHADNDEDASAGWSDVSGGEYRIEAQGDGFSASGALTVSGGVFDITSGGGSGQTPDESESAKALKAADGIAITDGTFDLDSADDGVHSNASVTIGGGTFWIAAGDDGIHADESVSVTGGSIQISESYEGIEGLNVDISGGEIRIAASDDGLNAGGGGDGSGFGGNFDGGRFGNGANKQGLRPEAPQNPDGGSGQLDMPGNPPEKMPENLPEESGTFSGEASLNLSGGVLWINADGDGLDSNGTLTVSGGEIYISGSVGGGDGALDYVNAGVITGGTVIAAGSAGMAQNFNSAEQGSVLLQTGSQAAGSSVQIADQYGTVLASYQPEKAYECVVISCPELKVGEAYTVTAGDFSQTVTLDGMIYGEGFGGFGGGFGGRR